MSTMQYFRSYFELKQYSEYVDGDIYNYCYVIVRNSETHEEISRTEPSLLSTVSNVAPEYLAFFKDIDFKGKNVNVSYKKDKNKGLLAWLKKIFTKEVQCIKE